MNTNTNAVTLISYMRKPNGRSIGAGLRAGVQHIQKSSNAEVYLISGTAVHDHSRTDAERWDGQNGDDHPIRTGEFRVHSENETLFVGDVFEDLPNSLCTQVDFLFLGVLVDVFPLGSDVEASSAEVGLIPTTTTVSRFAVLRTKISNEVFWAATSSKS